MTTPRRASRWAVVVCALVALLMTGCTPEQNAAYDSINVIRAQNGQRALLPSPHAMAKAQAWAQQLATANHLEHSDPRAGMPAGAAAIGENVGSGKDIAAINVGFMNSPSHRANLLDPRWNWVGTGVATSADGTLFVVQVFADYPG